MKPGVGILGLVWRVGATFCYASQFSDQVSPKADRAQEAIEGEIAQDFRFEGANIREAD